MVSKDEVYSVIAKILDVDKKEIQEDKKLYDSLGVDSTEMVELTIALSKQFSVKLDTKEISKFATPLEIVDLINKKKQQ